MVSNPLVAVTGDLFPQLLLSRAVQSLPRLRQLFPSELDAFDGPVEDELVVGSNTAKIILFTLTIFKLNLKF